MIRAALIAGILGLLTGGGGAFWLLKDGFDAKRELVEVQAALDRARGQITDLAQSLEIANRATASARADLAAVAEQREIEANRAAELEEQINAIRQAPGADAPLPDAVVDFIDGLYGP